MNERLRAKPIVIGALVTFFGGMICGIGVAVYSTGGDLAKMQTFEKDATIATRAAAILLVALVALAGGYLTARLAPHDPLRHGKRLALVMVIVGVPFMIVGAVVNGVGASTVAGLVSTAVSYGAIVLGAYLATDDEATEEATE